MKRRRFLKQSAAVGTALLGASTIPLAMSHAQQTSKPNILVIVVDQLRTPQWFPNQAILDSLLPSLARLRKGAVSFAHHYTAATACSPARGCLLTGLYAHQTYLLDTQENAQTPSLNPGFPTWGTFLRNIGYQTYWFGKWHVNNSCDIEQYGFGGGTCPSPNGSLGQGQAQDPNIANQFLQWIQNQGTTTPWCTTVSLVNPHDIAWYHRTNLVQGENNPPRRFLRLPDNYETPAQLEERGKPDLQRVLQNDTAIAFGRIPFDGPGFELPWLKLLDLYLQLQQYVDTQIGRVLDALEANPAIAQNTIILFTSDHGEYGGSHGLRNKSGGVYEEAIRVPLYVRDPTSIWTSAPELERTQLTSSVDIVPLLLTLASGNNDWRTQAQYAHLAQRLDLTALLRNPAAPGRKYILHTADETLVEGSKKDNIPSPPLYGSKVPWHVIGYRTAHAKLGLNAFWGTNTIALQAQNQQAECYDYSTAGGQIEVDNIYTRNPQFSQQLYQQLLNEALPNELRAPLPSFLQAAQQEAQQTYFAYLTQLGLN